MTNVLLLIMLLVNPAAPPTSAWSGWTAPRRNGGRKMLFDPVNNPDGWSRPEPADLTALDASLRERLELDKRIFRQHGRCWLAGRGMNLDDVAAVLDAAGADLGLHINHLGRSPSLDEWLAFPRISTLKHLSFNTAFLRAKGLDALLALGPNPDLETLDLSVCDIGLKGLRALQASDHYPALRALHLHANPDHDRTKWDEKAVKALLADSAKKPRGKTLRGLKVLGLMFWQLADAMDVLEADELVKGLDELWIWDEYYDAKQYKHVSNVKALPEGMRDRVVVGWERKNP